MNLDVVNNSSTTPKPLVFNMTRTIPFLTNAEDYFLTVSRFNLQTSNSLPVFIPDIQTGQNDPNLTIYTVTLVATNQGQTRSVTLPVMYETTDTTQPIPSPPTTTVDKSSSYYWIYNVNDWVSMLNKTLTNARIQLNNELGTSILAPYIQYDLTSGHFILHVSREAVGNNIFRVYLNPSLYNVLPLPSTYGPVAGSSLTTFSSSPTTYGYQVRMQNSIANRSTALVDGVSRDFLLTSTEFSPLSLLCPIRSIYFATNLLPIEPLLTQPPKIFDDPNLTGGNSGAPGITNILTDFQITVTPTNNYNGEISYLPTSEYRWIDLTQGVNLNKLDLSAFWKDKFGNAYPIFLPVNCSANIKLLFRRRDYYSGNNNI
jgi:hypothetical protein